MNSELTTRALWEQVASSTLSWTELLTVPGGSGKGEKCFGYLIDYAWDDTGAWYYAPVPDMQLEIRLPDGSTEGIALLPASEERVTLGICTSPDGNDRHHLSKPGKAKDKWKSISTRASVWLQRFKNGRLPAKFNWVSYRLQLWSGVRYGLGTLSAPLSMFGKLTDKFAYTALPLLGVNRNIREEWRYIHNTFGGVGLLSLKTEAIICRVNLFLQHWGLNTPIGTTLQTSMELLQLEAGCVECPLTIPYDPMGPLTTHCWLRSFWECVSTYSLQLEIEFAPLLLPRENDQTIMFVAIMLGYTGDALRSINRCRLACCAIFLSCIAHANGRCLDPSRGQKSEDYSYSTDYKFPREHPSPQDWCIWEEFWNRYCLSDGTLPRALGKWTHRTHRRWEWYFNQDADVLVQVRGSSKWKYCPCPRAASPYSTRHSQYYARVGNWLPEDLAGFLPATVRLEQDVVCLLGTGSSMLGKQGADAEEFWEHVRSWGGAWLWERVRTPYGLDAVVDAIASGSAIMVTDGSYCRNIRSEIDGAGWLIYCWQRKKVVLKGSTYELCTLAGSYRGELLGLLAQHLLILAVEEFYGLEAAPRGLVACDNLGGLNKSKQRRRKVPSSAKHADILRVLRRVHGRLKGTVAYKHVYGHQI